MNGICIRCSRPFEASGRVVTCSPDCALEAKRERERQRGPRAKPRKPPTPKTNRKRRKADDQTPNHFFRDVGPALKDPDYAPTVVADPEAVLAAAFVKMRADYGGAMSADDLAMLLAGLLANAPKKAAKIMQAAE